MFVSFSERIRADTKEDLMKELSGTGIVHIDRIVLIDKYIYEVVGWLSISDNYEITCKEI